MGNEQQSNRSNRGQFQSFQPTQPRNYPNTNQPTNTINERPPKIANLNNPNNRFPNVNIQKQPLSQPKDYERPNEGRPSNPYDSYYQINPQNPNLPNQQKLPQASLNNNQYQKQPKVENQVDKPKENIKKVVSDVERVISGVMPTEKKKEVFTGKLVEIFLPFFYIKDYFFRWIIRKCLWKRKKNSIQ